MTNLRQLILDLQTGADAFGTHLSAEQCWQAIAAIRVAEAAAAVERDKMDLEKAKAPMTGHGGPQPCVIALDRSRATLAKFLALWRVL